MNYDTSPNGWVGGGFTFDNFSTSAIETQNLSNFSVLNFGLKNTWGTLNWVKIEVIDDQEHKGIAYLANVNNANEQVWSLETLNFVAQGVDLTKARLIYFIVEGGPGQTGALEINRIPTA